MKNRHECFFCRHLGTIFSWFYEQNDEFWAQFWFFFEQSMLFIENNGSIVCPEKITSKPFIVFEKLIFPYEAWFSPFSFKNLSSWLYSKFNISKTSSGHPIFLCIFEISIKFGLRKSWFKNIFMVIFYGRQPIMKNMKFFITNKYFKGLSFFPSFLLSFFVVVDVDGRKKRKKGKITQETTFYLKISFAALVSLNIIATIPSLPCQKLLFQMISWKEKKKQGKRSNKYYLCTYVKNFIYVQLSTDKIHIPLALRSSGVDIELSPPWIIRRIHRCATLRQTLLRCMC